MSAITIFQAELNSALRHLGFTAHKIEKFLRVFEKNETSQGVTISLDATRAMLVNVNGSEQGLCLADFISAWWCFWSVVYNSADNSSSELQALGAMRALFFISACCKSPSLHTEMTTWWHQTKPLHHTTLESDV